MTNRVTQIDRKPRQANDALGNGIDVAPLLPAHAFEERVGAQFPEHRMRLIAVYRRDAVGDIVQRFDEYAADACREHQAERRIGREAENQQG